MSVKGPCRRVGGTLPLLMAVVGLRNMHVSKTLKNMHVSKTFKNMHVSKTLKNMHVSKTLRNMHVSKTLKNMHVSKPLRNMHVSKTLRLHRNEKLGSVPFSPTTLFPPFIFFSSVFSVFTVF